MLSEIHLLEQEIRAIQDDLDPNQLDRPLGVMYMIYVGFLNRREILRGNTS
ncbi:MAG: hypothetical protein LBR15_04745 [Methanobrevibacter sp.]|nr:hypothetical protein [Candidatus Methanovirga australis]